ncbi:MAG TPA: hypothetical protein VGM30_22355 [Puia sp.]|jgi:hypothetical protein
MGDSVWGNVVDKGAENPKWVVTLVLLILGVVLVLLGGNGGYEKVGVSIKDVNWRIVISVIGIIFIATSIFGYIKAGSEGMTADKTRKNYPIEILVPKIGTPLRSPIHISGKYSKPLPAENILVFELNPDSKRYWPKGPLVYNHEDKTWSAVVHIGNGNDRTRFIMIAYVGKDSLKFLNFYNRLSKDCDKYTGIENFPSDFHVLKQVEITLQKPL